MTTTYKFAFTWRGAWVSTTRYSKDDLVKHGGSVYKAVIANVGQAPVEGAYWTVFVERGSQVQAGLTFYTPEMYGAAGDDTTDDTAALQAAFDASSSTGAPVMLGPKTYCFTRLTVKTNLSVIGCGQLASILKCTDSTTLDAGVAWGSAVRRADDNSTVFYLRLENLGIVTATSSVTAAQTVFANVMGLNMAGCGYSHIQNVTVQGFGQAGIVLARCENGTEGLGFTGTSQDGNYNSFFNVRVQGNGAYRTATHTAHTITGNTNSNTTIDNVSAADMARLRIGDAISGTGIPSGATVATFASSTSFTISAAATATAAGITLTTARAQQANVLLLYKANSNKFYSLFEKGVVPNQTLTGDLTSGNKTVTNVSPADIAKLVIGQYLSGTGVANLAQVETIGATSFTMSVAATSTVTGSLTPNITQSRVTTGFAILHGNDNLLSGATFESITRGVWFGTNAFGNLIMQPRSEGLNDAFFTSSPLSGTPQTGGGNMVIGDYLSSSNARLDVANNGEFRYLASQFNNLRSGKLATTSLSTNVDNHFLDVVGILAHTDGMFYLKSPGFGDLTVAPRFQLRSTKQIVQANDVLASFEARNNDTSTNAAGVNAVINFKAFDTSGQTGFEFRTGKNDSPVGVLELNIHVRAMGGSWDSGHLALGAGSHIWQSLDADWQASAFYATTGAIRKNGSNLYTVTTAGISASSGGPTGTGTGIADGTVVWDYVSAAPAVTTSRLYWKTSAPTTATDGDRIFTSLTGSATYDPPSIAAAGTTTTTVTVTGAALGDYAQASFSLTLAGLMMTAYVSSANTVTVVLFNPTGGAIDLASGTLLARVDRN